MAEQEYQRLTWARRRPTGFIAFSATRSSLWLGKDHVLCIDTTGYTETYKRFYFRDIQAIIIRRTEGWKFTSLALGILATLFTLTAGLQGLVAMRYVFGLVAGLFALALILNLALGPSSTCHLRTAVQTEQLPSLNRIRRAHKVLARLRPLIAQPKGQPAADLAPPNIASTTPTQS